MYLLGPNYSKLKTNLRLAMYKLRLIQKKKIELTAKMRKEIADLIMAGKLQRAKFKVEHIIREDYYTDALEIVETYCDLLLARFALISNVKELDEGIAEAVSGLIWVAPHLTHDIKELKTIADALGSKYGSQYAKNCKEEYVETINEVLKEKLSLAIPSRLLVENYMIEISKNYNVLYEPDSYIMSRNKDNNDKFNGGGSGSSRPTSHQRAMLVNKIAFASDSFLDQINFPPEKESEVKENSTNQIPIPTLNTNPSRHKVEVDDSKNTSLQNKILSNEKSQIQGLQEEQSSNTKPSGTLKKKYIYDKDLSNDLKKKEYDLPLTPSDYIHNSLYTPKKDLSDDLKKKEYDLPFTPSDYLYNSLYTPKKELYKIITASKSDQLDYIPKDFNYDTSAPNKKEYGLPINSPETIKKRKLSESDVSQDFLKIHPLSQNCDLAQTISDTFISLYNLQEESSENINRFIHFTGIMNVQENPESKSNLLDLENPSDHSQSAFNNIDFDLSKSPSSLNTFYEFTGFPPMLSNAFYDLSNASNCVDDLINSPSEPKKTPSYSKESTSLKQVSSAQGMCIDKIHSFATLPKNSAERLSAPINVIYKFPKLPSVPNNEVYVLPKLPSVPHVNTPSEKNEDDEFEELCKRFGQLKKK